MKLLSRSAIATLVGFSVSSNCVGQLFLCGWAVGLSFNRRALLMCFCDSSGSGHHCTAPMPLGEVGQRACCSSSGTILAVAGCYYVWRFSLPVHRQAFLMLSCWIPAGISAMLVSVFGKQASVVTGTVILALSAIFLHDPVFDAYVHYQQLTVAFVTPVDSLTSQL